ncbi:helix-turn-helix domain-containing protein [Nocardia donostiensis]|uniref:helix-turn-helix domain-containing protein n=1 Tax=Nocardia donostiensis TaxID=1538463 RepID=UPI001115668A|nr:transcriptional regulator [Nocardia donostiensis]
MVVTRWTGVEVRALRTIALRVTQEEFAEILGFPVGTLRKWERRRETITLAGKFAAAMDTVFKRLDGDERTRFETALSAQTRTTREVRGAPGAADMFETPAELAQRLQSLNEMVGDSSFVDVIALGIDDVIGRYELEGPQKLAPGVVAARRHVEELLNQRRHPVELQRLYRTAAQLSGMLAYMAVNRGRFGHAKMYCHEALSIATLLEDRDLLAWVKGTQSFCSYYQGDYRAAITFAQEGLKVAGDGPQSIRLYSNGLARALGKIGDVGRVTDAIDAATTIANTLNTEPGLTPALTFEPYGHARLMANAATAFLAAGDYQRTLDYGQQVEECVNESDSVWSRSLVRLDMATAMLGKNHRDLEHAVQLGVEALAMSSDRPIRSVWQRAHDLAPILEQIPARSSAVYLSALHDWSSTARAFSAPDAYE